jgi:ABC-2 type transport system permease protein
MNKLLLWLLMLPSKLWRTMGADTDQLRAILDVKLKMDDRKPMAMGRAQKKQSKNNLVLHTFMAAIAGALCIFPLLMFRYDIFGLFGYFTILMFLLTFSLTTDYANVLVDGRDKFILLPRPLNESTLFLARMLHLFVYVFRTVLPMSLPGWITLGIAGGWQAAALFPIPLLLMVFMCIFIVNGAYVLILKFASPARFKNIIASFQIIFTIFSASAYYLISGAMNSTMLRELNPADLKWVVYFPSYWLAACWTWVGFDAALPHVGWLSILAIVFPVVCMWIAIKKLAPAFSVKLVAAESMGDSVNAVATQGRTARKHVYLKFANAMNKNDAARAGFMITWLQTGRSRAFKMKLYPSLVTAPLYFVFLLSQGKRSLVENIALLPTTQKHLFLLYIPAFALLNCMHYLPRSEQYKAAWVYYPAPLETPGYVLAGAFKALWLKFFAPYMLIIASIVLYLWGGRAAMDIVLAAVNVTLFALCMMYLTVKAFPFSITEEEKGADAGIRVFATFSLIAVLAAGHYFAVSIWWLKLTFTGLSLMMVMYVWLSYRGLQWEKIKQSI